MMNTYIYDYLKNYAESGIMRGHMPGHKGRSVISGLSEIYSMDITEIKGADSLFEADGIILESEKNMSRLYETHSTFYSAGGSTLCIQAMLMAMKQENRTVIAVRNVHRAFLNAAALLDIEVEWILPEYTDGILSGTIKKSDVEDALKKHDNACLYVTSPDYTGRTADIKGLAELCRRYDAPLLVDNAHGAHLHFFEESQHPIALGADMCCDSAHKMLPALTGSAMLHTSSEKYAEILRQCMSLFASTSPSYLILMSLDLCCKYISENIREDIRKNLGYISRFRKKFEGLLTFCDGEPFHITVRANENGYDGNELADLLRVNGVECEYSDSAIVVILMSPVSVEEDYEKLCHAMRNALNSAEKIPKTIGKAELKLPVRAMGIRQAVFSECEEIPIEKAAGRICASVKVPCPPAVPIAASGEIIDRSCINIFKNYGISSVIVVK